MKKRFKRSELGIAWGGELRAGGAKGMGGVAVLLKTWVEQQLSQAMVGRMVGRKEGNLFKCNQIGIRNG